MNDLGNQFTPHEVPPTTLHSGRWQNLPPTLHDLRYRLDAYADHVIEAVIIRLSLFHPFSISSTARRISSTILVPRIAHCAFRRA
jgi:hypothetical protein